MKKDHLQLIVETIASVSAVLVVLSGKIEAISNITGRIGYIAGGVLFVAGYTTWLILIYRGKKGKLTWTIDGGHIIRIRRFSFKTHAIVNAIFFLLLCRIGYDFYKYDPFFRHTDNPKRAAVFGSRPSDLRLLILPWQKECLLEGKSYDIGLVLKHRLEDMVRKDNISVQVYYLEDSASYRNFTRDSFNLLMKSYKANMIIHGSYSLSQCEGGGADKVCYMYQTDFRRFGIDSTATGEAYVMHDIHGLEDIREGAGQESIDFIIHEVAGMSEFWNRRYAKAVQMLERIKGYENNPEILFRLSTCYHEMNDSRNFRMMLERSLKLQPDNVEASIHWCIALLRDGKMDAVKEQLAKIDALAPRDINVLRDICLLYRTLKDTVRSDKYFQRFLAEVPDTGPNYKTLGAMYRDLKNYPRSRDYFEKAFAVCSKHVNDWNEVATAYMLLGDSVKAKPYFKGALVLDSASYDALYNMGILLYREKDYVQASEYIKKAAAIDSTSATVLIALGNSYMALDKKEKAVWYFEKVLGIYPDFIEGMVKAAVLNMQLKRYTAADVYLDRMVNYAPKNIETLNRIAYLCAEKENYSQAEVYYKRLLKLAPGHPAVLYNLASMSACQHKNEEALRLLERALKARPSLKDMLKKDHAFDKIKGQVDLIISSI